MLLTDYSLMESVVSKLVEKADSISDMRKTIINYTNNFREFKNMKANIINCLFDYEDSFFQLSHIIKTVTDTNRNYLQIFEKLKTKHFEFENRINELEYENKRLANLCESIKNNFLSVNEFNKDKDSFIKDLINKVNYLENVLKEYQKKYYIPKYSKIFEFNAQLVDAEKVRKLYNNMKIMERLKMEEIEKNGVELKKELDNRTQLKVMNSDSAKANSNDGNVKEEEIIKEVEDEDSNDRQIIKKIAERPKTPGNFRVKQQQKVLSQAKENLIGKPNTVSLPAPNQNTNFSPISINSEQNKKEYNDNFKKLDNAATANEILLKIFTDSELNFYLKNKHGDDYQIKLSDINVETEFLKKINSDMKNYIDKEKFKSSNFDMQEINNCLRSLSPKNFDFSAEYHPKKKPFSPYTKKTSDFFDSNIQHGGESQVLNASRDFYGTIRKSSKSPLGRVSMNFSTFNPYKNTKRNNNRTSNNSNYLESNIEEYEKTKGEREEKMKITNTRGFSGHSRKFNSDFLINSEITSELLRKPFKVGVNSPNDKFNGRESRYMY